MNSLSCRHTEKVHAFPARLAWLSLFIAVLLTATAVPGWAGNCSLETVKGTYVSLEQGTVLPGLNTSFPEAPVPYPVVITGHVTLDGAGNVSGTYNGNFGGQVVTEGPLEGTYEVTSDCAFSMTFTSGSGATHHIAGFMTGQGALAGSYFVYTDPGVVISGTVKKE